MKQLLIILSLVLGCLQPGYTQKPVLKFNKDGKFKIVQFTDVHYIHGNPKSAVSLERINEVLDAEKPDLVLFTGDVIYGQPAEEGMRTILNLAANRQIPFGVTFEIVRWKERRSHPVLYGLSLIFTDQGNRRL